MVSYELANSQPVRLLLQDAGGRTVREVNQGQQPAGRHSHAWNTASLAAGVYFCTVSAGDRAVTVPVRVTH